jgi:rfaE bifunctional protein nucleotidyltransferase chain/domain
MSKLLAREKIAKILEKRKGLVGFTSGAFDVLHLGHVRYLKKAKDSCDILVVGVNSDNSVKASKGPFRPIVPAKERAELVSHVDCVDYVFIFDEVKNHKNIEVLKPDLYIKGGDYKTKALTSAELVQRHGGKVKLIPFVQGKSTTEVIEKIQALPITSKIDKKIMTKAVFMDRDGTLIENVEYPKDPDKVRLLPSVIEGLRRLHKNEYALIIVTNQPGIGLGYNTLEDFYKVDRAFRKMLHSRGILIDRVYYCPHNLKENCECRKPLPYFAQRAQKELGIKTGDSYMVGDNASDMEFGKNAGMKTILVSKGSYDGPRPDYDAKNFSDAVDWILRKNIKKAKNKPG